MVTMAVRCRAFSHETGPRLHQVLVEPWPGHGVLVWDSVANHYTSCHTLSKRTVRRIRALLLTSAVGVTCS